MNREKGISSLAMVLMLLLLGSLMLQGLNQVQRQQLAMVNDETRMLRITAIVHSALQWGKVQPWGVAAGQQCRAYDKASQVCLRLFVDGSALLIAQSEAFRLWQSGTWTMGNIHFSLHGWSDFCPLKEIALCLPL